MTDKLTVVLSNNAAEIERLAGLMEDFGEKNCLPLKLIFNLNLALDELITNTISYGYDDNMSHVIEVEVTITGLGINLIITDDARAFNLLDVPPPDLDAPLEDREAGGLGVHFIRKIMDSIEYKRQEGQNILFMQKSLG